MPDRHRSLPLFLITPTYTTLKAPNVSRCVAAPRWSRIAQSISHVPCTFHLLPWSAAQVGTRPLRRFRAPPSVDPYYERQVFATVDVTRWLCLAKVVPSLLKRRKSSKWSTQVETGCIYEYKSELESPSWDRIGKILRDCCFLLFKVGYWLIYQCEFIDIQTPYKLASSRGNLGY